MRLNVSARGRAVLSAAIILNLLSYGRLQQQQPVKDNGASVLGIPQFFSDTPNRCYQTGELDSCVGEGQIVQQSEIDFSQGFDRIISLCPDTPFDQLGYTDAQIADQMKVCLNAVRVFPEAFNGSYQCNLDQFLQSITVPRRTPLNFYPQNALYRDISALDLAAVNHSDDMAFRNYVSHTTPEGVTFAQRFQQSGFTTYPIAENIAAGQNSIRDVMLAWMCSPGHRQNMMSCAFDSAGSGFAANESDEYVFFFTQSFGCSLQTRDCSCYSQDYTPDLYFQDVFPPLPTGQLYGLNMQFSNYDPSIGAISNITNNTIALVLNDTYGNLLGDFFTITTQDNSSASVQILTIPGSNATQYLIEVDTISSYNGSITTTIFNGNQIPPITFLVNQSLPLTITNNGFSI